MPPDYRPLCFVLIPCGRKSAAGGLTVDFDAVYRDVIAPAIADAGLDALRAGPAMTGAVHNALHEQLMLCEYAIADLTTADASVFHELGMRHAARPDCTLMLCAEGAARLPFDQQALRAMPYQLGVDGRPAHAALARAALATRLGDARKMATDTPVFELVQDFPDIQRLKTDVFRERVGIERAIKERLAAARGSGLDAVRSAAQALARAPGGLAGAAAGVVVDLYLSYRAVEGWDEMIALVPQMSAPLARSVLVQEQLGFALNRAGRGGEAERVLLGVLDRQGPSSETCALLGRVYKDRWESALKSGDSVNARGVLGQAIGAYLRGFEADWRDAYPGINAVTLMELSDPPDARRVKLIPVVAYAAARRIAGGQPDYWDFATQLELAVLAKDEAGALAALGNALAAVRERWEPANTAHNLRLIREARARRGETIQWALHAEQALAQWGAQ